MSDELEALRNEIADLRREVIALRGELQRINPPRVVAAPARPGSPWPWGPPVYAGVGAAISTGVDSLPYNAALEGWGGVS